MNRNEINKEIECLTIDDILDKCELRLKECSKDDVVYAESYHTRKLLLELKDIQIDRKFNTGDIVWILQNDECDDDGSDDDIRYDSYVFMATCGDYVIVATEYAHCKGDFLRQLVEMADESYENFGVDVEIFHKRKVFKTEEDVQKVIRIIKGE